MSQLPIEYQSPESLRTLANFLRGQNGVKVKSGIEHEKRVDYFKGLSLSASILHHHCFHSLANLLY